MADDERFDDRDGWIWMDGSLRPWREATLHVFSHSLHYAGAVFEGERAYGGKIFHLEDHTRRWTESARLLGYELPYSEEEINAACEEVLRANDLKDAYVRPVAWRGSDGMSVSAKGLAVRVAIGAWEWPTFYTAEQKMGGLRLKMSSWRRPSNETAPALSKASGLYMISTLTKEEAEAEGYDDGLMLDYRGLVAEASGANVVFAKGKELHTPKPDCFLNGITRRAVLEMARRRGWKVHERAIKPEEMADFDECFLVGTAVEVTPASQVGDYKFTPGEVCRTLIDDFEMEVRPKREGANDADAAAAG